MGVQISTPCLPTTSICSGDYGCGSDTSMVAVARIMPIFTGEEWDASRAYGALEVVEQPDGTMYITKCPTPAGTPLDDCVYWVVYNENMWKALEKEAAAREEADAELEAKVTAEAEQRAASDAALGKRVDDEVTARKNADTELESALTSEIDGLAATIPAKVSELDNDVPYLFDEQGGKEWVQSNVTGGSFSALHCNGSIWVAGTLSSGLYYSIDGETWTQSNITSAGINAVYGDGSIWVAAANNGLYYSTDGMVWTQAFEAVSFLSAVYTNGIIWVAAAHQGLYYSTDGKTWTQSNMTTAASCAYFDGNIWVAASSSANGGTGLYYSTDGKTWTQSNITSGYFPEVYGDGAIWVAGSNNGAGLYYSTDGKTWTQSNITSGNFYAIYSDGAIWVAGGVGAYYSTDGKTWSLSNLNSVINCAYGNGTVWVAGTDSSLYYSTDGKTWTKSNTTSGNITSANFEVVYQKDSIWVTGSSNRGLWYSEVKQYIDRKELNEALSDYKVKSIDVSDSDTLQEKLEELVFAINDGKVNSIRVSVSNSNNRIFLPASFYAEVDWEIEDERYAFAYLHLSYASPDNGIFIYSVRIAYENTWVVTLDATQYYAFNNGSLTSTSGYTLSSIEWW